MPAHRFRTQPLQGLAGSQLVIEGDEARHAARVKRLRVGEKVELLDGMGCIASGTIALVNPRAYHIRIDVAVVNEIAPDAPALHVMSAVPKGAHLEQMIAGLSQAGVASWRPLLCARSESDERALRLDRLTRIVTESAKQCGRAWDMELRDQVRFDDAVHTENLVLADHRASRYTTTGAAIVNLLIGPEGGWTEQERAAAAASGARLASFGRHIMRIETAAVAAATVVMHEHSKGDHR